MQQSVSMLHKYATPLLVAECYRCSTRSLRWSRLTVLLSIRSTSTGVPITTTQVGLPRSNTGRDREGGLQVTEQIFEVLTKSPGL